MTQEILPVIFKIVDSRWSGPTVAKTKKFETRLESNSSSHIKVENGCLVNYNSLGSIKPAIKAELYDWVQ